MTMNCIPGEAGEGEWMRAHLGDHHVAVKGAAAVVLGRPVDEAANLGDDGGTESDVGYKVAIPASVGCEVSGEGFAACGCWMMMLT